MNMTRTSPYSGKEIYFIGIKGVGMTMLAEFLKLQGAAVSGSDVAETFLTDQVLSRRKIRVKSPFAAGNLPARPDLIIHSSAYSPDNNEELASVRRQPGPAPVMSYAQALGAVFNRYRGVAVCGSHGKTTVTAWLGYVLARAGKKPNLLAGSRIPQLGGSSLSGSARYLVAEVDEYQNKLQYFQPFGVVLNNIDYDHPDFFKTPAAYRAAFAAFVKKIPASGFLVANIGDRQVRRLAQRCRGGVISYSLEGEGGAADYTAAEIVRRGAGQSFRLRHRGRDQGNFRIQLWGRHNVANALAVIAAARRLGVPLEQIRRHLASFRGTARRSELLGNYHGVPIIDDYAHHPTEVRSALQGLRERWPEKRLVTVFHPHTASRTAAYFQDFVASFPLADVLIILEIYTSAREAAGTVSGRQMAQAIQAYNRSKERAQTVSYQPSLATCAAHLRKFLRPGDLLVLMGAGDVFRIASQLKKRK